MREHFNKKVIDSKVNVVCKCCHTIMAGNVKSRSSHLQKHIKKTCNAIDWASIQKLGSSRTIQGTPRVTTSFDPNAVREKLMHMIIIHEYPLSIMDHTIF